LGILIGRATVVLRAWATAGDRDPKTIDGVTDLGGVECLTVGFEKREVIDEVPADVRHGPAASA